MKSLIALASIAVWMSVASPASAQIVRPSVTGPAQVPLRQLFPPTPLEQVREQSMQQSPPLPLPAPPAERWVPEQQVWSPQLGRNVVIPGHYEKRVSDQQYTVPPLPAYDVNSGITVPLPGGQRQGP
ncbi:MAG TPA: hypothetical protein VEL75_22945 [Candidatus Methylomirabilis sp.]|nr:hypothetical protein [Candidatus Methylomirabilis sp.]